MTKFKSNNVIQSLKNAFHGLKLVFCSQRNLVIEIITAICVLFTGIILNFSITDICILILVSLIVIVCELLNSVVEFTLDAIYKNHYSKLVEMAKDISAGMVLFSCLISVIIGVILFSKYLKVFVYN